MNRTAYVSGKISGLPRQNVADKFNVITNELTEMGYRVVKPFSVSDDSKSWTDGMKNDIKQMIECDEIHLLPDWQESRAAQLERNIAMILGMKLVYH